MISEYKLYTFLWPTYRLKKFERNLGTLEVQTLFPNSMSSKKGGLIVKSVESVPFERLRSLTSFRKIKVMFGDGDFFEVQPDQMLLERSAPLIRIAKTVKDVDKLLNKIDEISLKKREKQYLMHEFHPYKGRYYPQLIKPLLNITAKKGDIILDPFCGCGTTLLESYFNQMNSIGVDLNPIAYFISKVKTQSVNLDVDKLKKIMKKLLKHCKREITVFRNQLNQKTSLDIFTQYSSSIIVRLKNRIPNIPNIYKWFSEGIIEELLIILENINKINENDIKDFCKLALSSIIKRVSNWDPKQVRQRLLKKPRENVPVLEIFEKQIKKNYLIVYTYSKIRSKLHIDPECYSEVHLHDSRRLDFIEDKSIDAIVTSPPYATALPYIDTDRLSMVIIGLMEYRSKEQIKKMMIGERDITPSERDRLEEEFLDNYYTLPLPSIAKETIKKILEANRKHNVGFRRRNKASTLYRYFMGMSSCILEMARVLKNDCYCSIIIGTNRTKAGGKEWVNIKTHEILKEIAKDAGFKDIKTIPITPTAPYMIHVNNRISDEYILIFKN